MSAASKLFDVNVDAKGNGFAKCKLCGASVAVSNWGTGSRLDHLTGSGKGSIAHNIPNDRLADVAKLIVDRPSDQPSIMDAFQAAPASAYKSTTPIEASSALVEAITELLVVHRLPFRLVEAPEFLKMLAVTRPDNRPVKLPGRKAFSRRVANMYTAVAGEIKKELAKPGVHPHIIFDLWSNDGVRCGGVFFLFFFYFFYRLSVFSLIDFSDLPLLPATWPCSCRS